MEEEEWLHYNKKYKHVKSNQVNFKKQLEEDVFLFIDTNKIMLIFIQ